MTAAQGQSSSVDPEPAYKFQVGDRLVGDGYPCLIVGEVGQAHEGSLGMAHAFIDALADAGADAVKFQTHIAAAESTPAEPFRVPLSGQDCSRYEYWKRIEFSAEDWGGLCRHAEARGLLFLSSPFSVEAFELLQRCGVKWWKVASGEICHLALLEQMARTQKPMVVSTGMGSWQEIQRAVDCARVLGAPVAILQCTSKYPTAPEEVGVQLLPILRRRFRCLVGLSDHSGTPYPSLIAAGIGGSILEVHVTLSRQMYGPDVVASVTTQELQDLVRGVRFVERMRAGVPDKDALARELSTTRSMFFRSLAARREIPAGEVLSDGDLVLKKPGTGMPAEALAHVLGRGVTRKIPADALLQPEDLAPIQTRDGGRKASHRRERSAVGGA